MRQIAMNPITLLTLLSLGCIFALWFRLESSAFDRRRMVRARDLRSSDRPRR